MMLNQTQAIAHSLSQHSTAWWSDGQLVGKDPNTQIVDENTNFNRTTQMHIFVVIIDTFCIALFSGVRKFNSTACGKRSKHINS